MGIDAPDMRSKILSIDETRKLWLAVLDCQATSRMRDENILKIFKSSNPKSND